MTDNNNNSNGQNNRQDNGQALVDMMTFDPAKEPSVGLDAFNEVLREMAEERQKKAKEKARETLTKAADLRKKMVVAERDFNKQKKEFDKELGKLLNTLRQALNGGQAPVVEAAVEAEAEQQN